MEGRTVSLKWTEWLNNKCQFEMEVQFKEGIAGIYCFDESTYQTTAIHLGVPSEVELDKGGFKPIPWPAWKSELNYRKHLYGDLGAALYENMYSYYIVGSETVILLDVADSEPVIEG
ncbi:MAG: hypothetical protein L3J22_10505 [Xanthomonadales bacterium]|nr:hypothetical protein [Xanthomonadales bacterium]